jgi:hypothetical protein
LQASSGADFKPNDDALGRNFVETRIAIGVQQSPSPPDERLVLGELFDMMP